MGLIGELRRKGISWKNEKKIDNTSTNLAISAISSFYISRLARLRRRAPGWHRF